MGSIVIKSAQLNRPLMPNLEELPEDEDLEPIAPAPTGPRGPAPTPEEVRWADDDEAPDEDNLDVAPSAPIPPPQDVTDQGFLPVEPEQEEPVEPEKSFEELEEEQSELDRKNKELSTREKIWYALNNPGLLLTIKYTSLAGWTSERSVGPDYVYWAGTHRHVMVAWCYLRNDWRAFIVDRITEANLEDPNEQRT
jgi:hypothetical protein